MDRLAEIVAQDPGMAARVLKLANSALYSVRAQIGSVHQAITLLGARQVNDLVLVTAVARAFKGVSNALMNMDLFWETSIHTAALASVLGRLGSKGRADSLFTSGLLHDIGHLLMYEVVPTASALALERSTGRPWDRYKYERELVGCDYAEVGGELLRQWQLPEYLVRPVAQHVEPLDATEYLYESAIIHLAACMVRSDSPEVNLAERRAVLDPRVLERVQLEEDQCRDAQAEADKLAREVLGLIFPGHGEFT